MSKRNVLKLALGATAAASCLVTGSLQAQIAQRPLLSSASPVAPNIMFIMDDSSSMSANAIYQYGGSEGVYGMSGPGSTSGNSLTTNQYASRSPDVNLMYYDPRVTYKRRVNADGSSMPNGSTAGINSFKVYFKGKAGTYKVTSVSIVSGGSYSSKPSAKFPNAPAGGMTAAVNLTSTSIAQITGVNLSRGGFYSACPSASSVTFSAPAAGGTQAAATAVTCTPRTNGIIAVALNSGNTFTNASCVAGTVITATYRNQGSGTGAVIKATIGSSGGSRIVTGFTIENPGRNFGGSTQVRVTCGGQNRDYNVTRGSYQEITGVTVNANSGYTGGGHTVTFPVGMGGSFSAAAGTPTVGTRWTITGVTLVTGGSRYTTPPTLTLSPAGSPDAEFSYTYETEAGTGQVNARWNGTGSATSASDYFTPSYLPDAGSPLAPGAEVIPYPNTADANTKKYPKFLNRTDCVATTHCTWEEEQQNYANWKAYHSTRMDIAKTGIGLAFQPLAVPNGNQAQFRLGWATINRLNDASVVEKNVRDYTASVRDDFFRWLYKNHQVYNATPNKNALNKIGQFFTRADSKGPWANSPDPNSTSITAGGTDSTHASCRRSYALLMTDGYYGDSVSIGDWDSTERTVTTSPNTYVYKPIGPYSDKKTGSGISNTFADVAARWWLTDLRPDLDNKVRPVPGDEAFWQHLNFYAIGLGVNGLLDASNPSVLASLTGSTSRTLDWGTPSISSRSTIDDMWHATINGRGKMLSAKTSDELMEAISNMISDISGKEGTQAGVAVSTLSLNAGSKKYTPSYTPVSWNGNLTAYKLDPATGNQLATPAWQVETPITGTNPTQHVSTIPDEPNRKIYAGTGTNSGTKAVEFTYSALGGLLSQITGASEDLIRYLRGDKSQEGSTYRTRYTKLGDIVNSTPAYVKDSLDMQYDKLPDSTPGKNSYRDFVNAKKARAEGVVFVGANDGMLHAFRDGKYDAGGNTLSPGGAEIFAYVPYAVLPAIHELANKSYVHRYYVDGPVVEADAYIGGAWKNIVIGTTGAGAGRLGVANTAPRTSVFAIDVTGLNGANVATALNANSVMWEIGSWLGGNYEEIGHVLFDVQTGYTRSGKWVAVFGNGYGSKSCKPQLFIVNLADGSLVKMITPPSAVGSGNCNDSTNSNANGLGGVRLVRDENQVIIGAYAGDLQGTMWRFDLSSTSEASWTASALFQGSETQPITAPPTVLALPMVGTTKPDTGYMVVFGTGKFFEEADKNSTNEQRLYGIHDPKDFGETAAAALTGTGSLVEQTISEGGTDAGNTYFKVSNEPIQYDGPLAKRGWYINLTNSNRQRLVYPMELLAQRFVVADTMSPEGVPTDPCSTEFGGVGYLYVIDALNGGGPDEAVFDTNGDGNIDSQDLVVNGVLGEADGRNVSLLVSQDDLASKYANVSGGSPGSTLIQISCKLTNTCKVTGGGTYQRQWRQLFLR